MFECTKIKFENVSRKRIIFASTKVDLFIRDSDSKLNLCFILVSWLQFKIIAYI
jgi:hypothetical protein